MLKIITIVLLVGIFAFSSASTSIPNSPNLFPQVNSNLSQIRQKSSNFCYDDVDCENSQLGFHSSCVSNACTCDFGYKKAFSSEKCTKIACSYDYDCSASFSHSRCDITGTCVCEINYTLNSATASCEKKKDCTYDWECSGIFTRCNALNKCVCDYGYSKDSSGECSDDLDDYYILPAVFTTIGVSLMLIIILAVVIVIYRSKKMARTGGMVSGTGQPGFGPQPNYQVTFQPAPPMYAAPYGNVQEPPPQYAASYSQPAEATTSIQTHPRKM